MKREYLLPSLVIAAGLVVIALSIAWPRLAPPSDNWTEEQAQAYAAASREYHRAASLPPSQVTPAERDAAEQMYQQLRNQLDQARGGGVMLAMVLQMVGVGLGLVGAVWLIVKQNQAEDRRADTR